MMRQRKAKPPSCCCGGRRRSATELSAEGFAAYKRGNAAQHHDAASALRAYRRCATLFRAAAAAAGPAATASLAHSRSICLLKAGNALMEGLGRAAEALRLYARARSLRPGERYFAAVLNAAIAHKRLGRTAEARRPRPPQRDVRLPHATARPPGRAPAAAAADPSPQAVRSPCVSVRPAGRAALPRMEPPSRLRAALR